MESLIDNEKKVMLGEVLAGLAQDRKTLPSKLFYDSRGSELFEQICSSDEYYLTDTEIRIMQNSIHEIAEVLGSGIVLIELGSGSSSKTRLLLDYLDDVRAYMPVDISEDFLGGAVSLLQKEYPEIRIIPVAGDYTRLLNLPTGSSGNKKVVYFPGSTIGNFTPAYARGFLEMIARNTGHGGGLLIGVDLRKDPDVLEAAYNDSAGITAEFNKNILWRLNRELEADFDPGMFTHRAFFNEEESRIEMHLVSRADQRIQIADEIIHIGEGESIHTENSYKYTIGGFSNVTRGIFERRKIWTDDEDYFCVQYLEAVQEGL